MRHFIADYDAIVESRKRALPYMLEAHRSMWQSDIGMNRFIGRARESTVTFGVRLCPRSSTSVQFCA